MMRGNDDKRKPEILILAPLEIATPIRTAISPFARVTCSNVPQEQDEARWLLSLLLPSSSDSPTDFFHWALYDCVIILDSWLLNDGNKLNLVPLGLAFAELNSSVYGNFWTRKIVLQTVRFELGAGEAVNDPIELRCLGIDVVPLADGTPVVPRLRKAVSCLVRDPQIPGVSESIAICGLAEARERAMRAAEEELRKYIADVAEVVLLEDDLSQLREICRVVHGASFPDDGDLGKGVTEPKRTFLVDGSGQLHEYGEFQELLDACRESFQRVNNRSPRRHLIFVTDILLRLPGSRETGIDVIEELRRELRHGVGIVAFSGLRSAFITSSAYQRGADFVVQKGGRLDDPHPQLADTGLAELMLSLASLCFQKRFLQKHRDTTILDQQNDAARVEGARTALRTLKTVLPRHIVSRHLQEEWHDTCYLLEVAALYPAEKRVEVHLHFDQKYGENDGR